MRALHEWYKCMSCNFCCAFIYYYNECKVTCPGEKYNVKSEEISSYMMEVRM